MILDIMCGLGGLVVGVPVGVVATLKFMFRVRTPKEITADLQSIDLTMFHTSRDGES